jgi:hypothetical protein
MSFAIQSLRKICCTSTAAYKNVRVAVLASGEQMIGVFHYRGDGLFALQTSLRRIFLKKILFISNQTG